MPPAIEVQPVAAAPEDQVTVVGRDFFVGCDDTAEPGEPFPETPGPPDTNIQIVFVQNGAQQTIGVVAANESSQFSEAVTVPTSASSGDAIIRAVGANGTSEASLMVMVALPETGSAWASPVLWVGALTLLAGIGFAVMGALVGRQR